MADIKEAYTEKYDIADLWKYRIPIKRNVDYVKNEAIYQMKLKEKTVHMMDRCCGCSRPRKEHFPWCKDYSGFTLATDKFVEYNL